MGNINVSLNIKNEETCRLASELAHLTGESKTTAITIALKDRLEREKSRRDTETRVQRLLAIGRDGAEVLASGPAAADHADLLYDEHGLPK